MFNRSEFNQKIQQEFEDFKEFTMDLSKAEVFEIAHEINFKNVLSEYLINNDFVSDEVAEKLNNIDDDILDFIYELYSYSYDEYGFEVYEAIDELIYEFENEFDDIEQ